MAVATVFQSPTLTRERYEESVRLIAGKDQLESVADWPVDGILAHIAGDSPSGFRVVDIWESEEAFARFGETLLPVLQEIGVEGAPEIYPVHTYVTA